MSYRYLILLSSHLLEYNSMQHRNFVGLQLLKRQINFHICRNHSYSHSHIRCLSSNLNSSLRFSSTSNSSSSSSSICSSTINSLGLDSKRRIILRGPQMFHQFCTKSSTKQETTKSTNGTTTNEQLFGETANMSIFAKFKHMYKQYWYVLIPVHVLTSMGWFGGFYYLSKSGVDIPALLQYIPLSDHARESVQGFDMGHYAFAYLCYKLTTPLHYALTLGCTTIAIKYLVQRGYIKPIPAKSELIKMYKDKKVAACTAGVKAANMEKDEQQQQQQDENRKTK